MKQNAEKPAYPCEVNQQGNGVQTGGMSGITTGLTKREMFAMAAMQGMLSACNGTLGDHSGQEHLAKIAVTMADELLKQLGE